jgi:hypothetical protein
MSQYQEKKIYKHSFIFNSNNFLYLGRTFTEALEEKNVQIMREVQLIAEKEHNDHCYLGHKILQLFKQVLKELCQKIRSARKSVVRLDWL